MFRRRLLWLLAAAALGLSLGAGQLVRLTVVRGPALREEAEAALVSRAWTPGVRGRILDRHGRVLAKDRPSFDVAVDYDLVAGGVAWARGQAGRVTRQLHKDRWPELSPEQRRELIDLAMPAFMDHLDAMWDELARQGGGTRGALEARRESIRRDVDRRYSAVVRARLTDELEAELALGREITEEVETRVQRRAGRDIEEQRAPHVVLAGVPDRAAFELQRLLDVRVDLPVPDGRGGSASASVPLLPGVRVVPSGDREYPLDAVAVGVDLSTLPGPLRAAGTRTVGVRGVAYHLLGRMRPRATREDNERRRARIEADPAFAARVRTPEGVPGLSGPVDRGAYEDADWTGLGGLEEAREDELRGLRGLTVERRETGERTTIEPRPGMDLALTIDAMLQARVQAAMSPELGLAVAQDWHHALGRDNPTVPDGTPLHGGAVVLDIDSGEILAMVSTPSLSRDELRDAPEAVFAEPHNAALDLPWIDRTIQRPYPPGSIAKAMLLAEAITRGAVEPDAPIPCTGSLHPDRPDMFRCWLFKQHGMTHDAYFGHAPSAREALMVSCNIYFFTLGQRLGPEGVSRAFRAFGLGEPLGIGLEKPGQDFVEFPGYLGTRADGTPAAASAPGRISPSDAVQMGIGQGPVAWTPLHAADAYATLARGGVRVRPTLLGGRGSAEPVDLKLDPRAVGLALEGLRLAVADERGTGHHLTLPEGVKEPHFNVPNVVVWGKTGTATAPLVLTREGDALHHLSVDPAVIALAAGDPGFRVPEGRRVLRWGDHSWFVVLVGRAGEGRPRYAISVMMEYAGSGGKVSGPIVNQIMHALVAEGYL